MTDALDHIRAIADELSVDVGETLPRRVREAVDGLDETFLREATALLLDRMAHSLWRQRNLRIEREAERAAQDAHAEEDRAARLAAREATGGYAHGSANKRNRCRCEMCEAARDRREEIEERHQERLWERLNDIAQQHAAELKIEWTQELLSSGFKLADGTILIWADATVEQHQERIDMLMGNAAGNLEAAARHEAAVRTIEAAGAKTLGEALAVDRAA